MQNEIDELRRRLEKAEKALEQIEEIYIDGSDTYQDWLDMGEIARNYFYEDNSTNTFEIGDEVLVKGHHITKDKKIGLVEEVRDKIKVSFDEMWSGWYDPKHLEKIPISYVFEDDVNWVNTDPDEMYEGSRIDCD